MHCCLLATSYHHSEGDWQRHVFWLLPVLMHAWPCKYCRCRFPMEVQQAVTGCCQAALRAVLTNQADAPNCRRHDASVYAPNRHLALHNWLLLPAATTCPWIERRGCLPKQELWLLAQMRRHGTMQPRRRCAGGGGSKERAGALPLHYDRISAPVSTTASRAAPFKGLPAVRRSQTR